MTLSLSTTRQPPRIPQNITGRYACASDRPEWFPAHAGRSRTASCQLTGFRSLFLGAGSGAATTAMSAMQTLVHPRVAATATTAVPSSPTLSSNAGRSTEITQGTWQNTKGIPKSTIALTVGIGAPFLLITMGSIMIWGYIIGRREKSGREFRFQRRKTEQSSQQGNGRAILELEGREVQ